VIAVPDEADRAHRRSQERHRVRADREERRVPQVEQAGESDNNVQAEGEDDEQRDRDGLRLPAQSEQVVDEREQERRADADDRSQHLLLSCLAGRRVPPAKRRASARWRLRHRRLGLHAFSPVS
jgi:hypothetical protein